MKSPVDFLTGQDADDPSCVVHHRKPFMPVAPHRLIGALHRAVLMKGMHAVGHDLPHGDLGLGVSAHDLDQFVVYFIQRVVPNQGCRRAAVPPAIENSSDLAYVNRRRGTARHQLDMIPQADQEEQRIRLVQILQVVGQDGYLFDVVGHLCPGDDDRLTGERKGFQVTIQPVV